MIKKLKPGEIVDILKKEIELVDINQVEKEDQGEIIEILDGIALLSGLRGVMLNEEVEFENKVRGVAFNLEIDNVGVLILGSLEGLSAGMTARRLKRLLNVPVGDESIGRVIDPIGRPLDGKGPIDAKEYRNIEMKALGVVSRKEVNEPMQTGIKIIDAIVPIGRGQRELIIGDRQTGKTTVAIDAILNQRDQNVKCIYVAIGQKQSTVATIVDKLRSLGAMEYTTVVVASAAYPSPFQFYAPYAATALAEYFMLKGEHVLIVYDDLTKHAQAYRELSLLVKRPPGREAYPGDVFYLHSRLLERSAKLSDELGGGSITSLPIIETQAGDVSAYIPTNVISITDGQIFLDKELFNSGQRPAMDVGISVSRVGGAAQTKAMKKAVGTLKADLQQYLEVKAFSQFASDLDEETRRQLEYGSKLMELLKQRQQEPLNVIDQVIALFAVTNGHFNKVGLARVKECEKELVSYIKAMHATLYEKITKEKAISDEITAEFNKAIGEFTARFSG